MRSASSHRIHAEEKRKLAEAISMAAVGVAQWWDVLFEISTPIGRDWVPVDACVSGIADYAHQALRILQRLNRLNQT